MSICTWRLKKNGKAMEILIADPKTRMIIRTMELSFTKTMTEAEALRYMDLHHPWESPLDRKADKESAER